MMKRKMKSVAPKFALAAAAAHIQTGNRSWNGKREGARLTQRRKQQSNKWKERKKETDSLCLYSSLSVLLLIKNGFKSCNGWRLLTIATVGRHAGKKTSRVLWVVFSISFSITRGSRKRGRQAGKKKSKSDKKLKREKTGVLTLGFMRQTTTKGVEKEEEGDILLCN